MKKTPAIVLMLKAPVSGAVKTRLARDVGSEAATRIYRQLVEHQLKQLPRDWPVEIHFAPADCESSMTGWLGSCHRYFPQSDGDLGARLLHAATVAFGNRCENVIFLGGDCPGVTTELLKECANALTRHDVTIGPARDGGYYLLGLTKLEARIFENIDWSSDRVLVQTLARIEQMGLSCFHLPELEDVDDLDSWERCRGQLRDN